MRHNMPNLFERLIDNLIKDTAENRTYLKSIAESLQLRKAEESPHKLNLHTATLVAGSSVGIGQLVGVRKLITIMAYPDTDILFVAAEKSTLDNVVLEYYETSAYPQGDYLVWDPGIFNPLPIETTANIYVACPASGPTISYYEVGYDRDMPKSGTADLRRVINGE